jgi:hypothetical protein
MDLTTSGPPIQHVEKTMWRRVEKKRTRVPSAINHNDRRDCLSRSAPMRKSVAGKNRKTSSWFETDAEQETATAESVDALC